MIDASVSITTEKDGYLAGKTIAKESLGGMKVKPKMAILAVDHLTKKKYNYSDVAKGVYEELGPETHIIGSTVNGILVNDRFALRSAGLMLIGGDINLKDVFNYPNSRMDYKNIAADLLKKSAKITNPNDNVMLMFQDGSKFAVEMMSQQEQLNHPMVSKMTGLVKRAFKKNFANFWKEGKGNPSTQELLTELFKKNWKIPIVGNLATNSQDFQSYEFFNDNVQEDSVLGVIMNATENSKIGYGYGAGAEPMGVSCDINKSIGNFFLKINKKPAFDGFCEAANLEPESLEELKYQGYLNVSNMFGARDIVDGKEYIHLTATLTNPNLRNLIISGFPFEKTPDKIELFQSNLNILLNTTKNAINEAKADIKEPKFLLGIDCILRWSSYGDNFPKVIKTIRETVGEDVPRMIVGSGGEVFGVKADDYYANNMTFLTLIGGDN